MKTLVIHPHDPSTDFLKSIYRNKPFTVISNNISHKKLKSEILNHDRIIMLGHGTTKGLIGHDRFIINSRLVYLLRDKIGIYVWCNADVFVNKYNLQGFNTGMIISEIDESIDYNVKSTYAELQESNNKLAHSISKFLDDSDILSKITDSYNGDSDVIKFNRNNLYFK